jgi:SOS response regulatory protein OraA/RecX
VARAEQLAGRGYGDEWIRADLASQGVDAEAVEAALLELTPERERAEPLAVDLRSARTLARKGFSEDVVESVVARLHRTPAEE